MITMFNFLTHMCKNKTIANILYSQLTLSYYYVNDLILY